jgi:translation elongation factor EF-G
MIMKEYTTESIRNISLVSHSSAGKTMLAEAFLHLTGATTCLGRWGERQTGGLASYLQRSIHCR